MGTFTAPSTNSSSCGERTAAHINNFELGQHGRKSDQRVGLPGINTMRPGRLDELAMHPTPKPVAMVADAIKDCSNRNGIILDPFMGSGTTLIAAERTGRRARGIELDPAYVDVAIRRWQTYTGKCAVLVATQQTFEEVEEERRPAARPDIRLNELQVKTDGAAL